MSFRHDCKASGVCWLKSQPDWKMIEDCFPGKIRPGDVDGLVEVNGNLLLIEWKNPGDHLEHAQDIAFTKGSLHNRLTAVHVAGQASVPSVTEFTVYANGERSKPKKGDLADFRRFCRLWADAAKDGPASMGIFHLFDCGVAAA